ncbi:MAG: hypothetical protein HYZ45_02520 [Burkholderiales bacterium]|nr:hypothetical protein [Burkholderiales bacterium]
MPAALSLEFARYSLATKAIGLGEHHDSPNARLVIDEWIKVGIVTDLVLELSEPWDDEGVMSPDYLGVVSGLDKKWNNPYPLNKLIRVACEAKVNVHCWDPGDSYKIKDMNQNVANRNSVIASKFREHFGRGRYAVTQAPGWVILMGADHFAKGEQPLSSLLLGLVWADLSPE